VGDDAVRLGAAASATHAPGRGYELARVLCSDALVASAHVLEHEELGEQVRLERWQRVTLEIRTGERAVDRAIEVAVRGQPHTLGRRIQHVLGESTGDRREREQVLV